MGSERYLDFMICFMNRRSGLVNTGKDNVQGHCWVTIVSECEIAWVINMPELTLVDATGENGLRLCLEHTGILL
jgi:hypothetical protein